MGIRQGWYDKGATAPTYSSDFDAALMRSVIRSGVVPGYGDDMVVTATDPVSMNIRVGLGAIFNEGRWLEVHTDIETRLVPDSDATNPRIDRVVIRNDFLADPDATVLVIKTGTPAVNPVPPALQRDSTWWERSVAQIRVNAGALSVTASNITDERDDPAVCGRADTHGLVAHATASILDHPDGSIVDAKIGNRTASDTSAPTGDTAQLGTFLSWLTNRIKTITGESGWRTAPVRSLRQLNDAKVERAGDTMTGRLNVKAGQDTTGVEIQADAGTAEGFLRLTFNQITRWAANVRVTNRLFRFMETDTIMARVHASEFRVYGTIGDVENEVRHDGNSDGWVTTARLALAAVVTDRIADLAVTAAKIADGAVTATKIATDAVTAVKIAAGAVTTVKLADAAVTPVKTNGAIAKIETGSYTGDGATNRTISTGLANLQTVLVFSDVSSGTDAGIGIGVRGAASGIAQADITNTTIHHTVPGASNSVNHPTVNATSFAVSGGITPPPLNNTNVIYRWVAIGQ